LAKFEVRKFPVIIDGKQTIRIKIPERATLLTFRSRLGEPVIYAKVPLSAKKETRTFKVIPCCVPLTDDPDLVYIGTTEWAGEGWHLFEVVTPAT